MSVGHNPDDLKYPDNSKLEPGLSGVVKVNWSPESQCLFVHGCGWITIKRPDDPNDPKFEILSGSPNLSEIE